MKTLLLIGTLAFSLNSFSQQDSLSFMSNRDLKKAVKHNQEIPRLTYFIHSGDSIIQMFNVSVKKINSDAEVVGYSTELEKEKIELYNRMLNNDKLKGMSEEDKYNANQVHIFTEQFSINNKRIVLSLSLIEKYVLYNKTKPVHRKRNNGWIVSAVVGGVGFVGVVYVVKRAIDGFIDYLFFY